jgi:hypothetical protein
MASMSEPSASLVGDADSGANSARGSSQGVDRDSGPDSGPETGRQSLDDATTPGDREGLLRHPLTLWVAFSIVHTVLILLCLHAPGWPLGDVEAVYKLWVAQSANGGSQVGIDEPWVYPILAYIPMALANLLGPALYVQVWLGLVTLLNAAAFAVLSGGLRRRRARPRWRVIAAWWWLAFLLLLGPIALARIDAVTVPIAIIALLLVAGRPAVGAALLTVAAWVKVWPAALVAALLVASRARLRVLQSAVGVSITVIAVSMVLGGASYVLSFVSEQTGRGLQIESPVSTIWMWQAVVGVPGAGVYYDHDILTYQVAGAGTALASALMTPLMAFAAAAVVLLGALRMREGAHFARVFPPLALALVLVLIVFNKVGSPQFMTWLAAPIVLGLIYRRRQWLLPAVLGLALAVLTQLIYPYLYGALLAASPGMVLLLTLRNLLQIVLLGWAVYALARAPRHPTTAHPPTLE